MLAKTPFFRVRLHIGIMLLVILSCGILFKGVLTIVHDQSAQSAQVNAKSHFQERASILTKHLSSVFDSAKLTAAIQISNPLSHTPIDANGLAHPMAQPFIVAVTHTPAVYSVYLSHPNGNFLQVINALNDPQIAKARSAPPNTAYIVRAIDRSNGKSIESWRFLDANRRMLDVRISKEVTFDPRVRPWYRKAMQSEEVTFSDPYVFHSNSELGISAAIQSSDHEGEIIGVDLTLGGLDAFLTHRIHWPGSHAVLLDRQKQVLAQAHIPSKSGLVTLPLPLLSNLDDANQTWAMRFSSLYSPQSGQRARMVGPEGMEEILYVNDLDGLDSPVTLALSAPLASFMGPVETMFDNIRSLTIILLAVLLPVALMAAWLLSRNLGQLSTAFQGFARTESVTGLPGGSFITEANDLIESAGKMLKTLQSRTEQRDASQKRLHKLIELGISIGSERKRNKLLRSILTGGVEMSRSDAGTLYLRQDDDTLTFAIRTKTDELPDIRLPLFDETGAPNSRFVATHVGATGEIVRIDDVYRETRFDMSGAKSVDKDTGYRTVSMLCMPLKTHEGEILGVLQLLNALDEDGQPRPYRDEDIGFVEAVAAQAAVALANHHLVEGLRKLTDAFIQVIAGAIDAKSPYTGGHCNRVPMLAQMLAEAAERSDSGPFADFHFANDDERYEFKIAGWLHDCGKVVTPEHIVDKATKLETIYNRIHEVRMRYEALYRDVEIDYWRDMTEPSADQEALAAKRDAELARLQEEYAFIARCNEGGEFMDPEDIQRLRAIAEQTWTRHFDDRIGLSQDELLRYGDEPPIAPPATEPLLADKPHHVTPRRMADPSKPYGDNPYGFTMAVPDNKQNMGELYNLAVSRGTLTAEDRYIINGHMLQTISMLETLPFPKFLKRVPEYAGSHHETMTGSGYPRGLRKEDMSVPARMMAIADIFEALTASDRPYKKPKSLSEAVRILSFMRNDGHVDPELFDLFLTSGVYRQYGEQFLQPEQCDEVDIAHYLSDDAKTAS
ncbi:HD domain-containing phosphohydrolase [Magnetofaba australis]|uniref:Putative HD-domain-containing protein n=1 Tax=Magnetofaba australis IT-1 TaxID=1434232 RepID=A0A1Y2KAN9_9PROT|nr:HD domain-containing phosphohydrolase [Magnetofaba australis]OSM06994.1 putative HD-domain-containing protein [Magnetofaba australis IT-1]